MNWGVGFYESDLRLYYYNHSEPDEIYAQGYDEQNFYYMLYMIKGSAKVIFSDYSASIASPCLIISKPYCQPQILMDSKENHEFMRIEFPPSTFSGVEDEADFLRAFHQGSSADLIYLLDEAQNLSLEPLLYSIRTCLLVHYSRGHILPRVQSLISELCIDYDSLHKDLIPSTDSIAVKVMDYIKRHHTEKITLSQVQKKFFISKPTINTIVMRSSGRTFLDYVNFLRLRDAKKMLKKGNISVSKVGELCGYPVYSTFFRAYKREFGITPTQDFNRKTRQYWPLTKKKK